MPCCCKSRNAPLNWEMRSSKNKNIGTGAKVAKYVTALLATAVLVFGILTVLALQSKLSAGMTQTFNKMATALFTDLTTLSAIFISTGSAGMVACYFLRPSKKAIEA